MPKRRSPGEGSIYQEKAGKHAGKWAAVATVSRPNEPRRRRVFRGPTREHVKQALAAFHRTDPTVQRSDGRETVAGLLQAFLDERAARRKARTVEQYHDVVRLHIVPFIGNRPVRDFGADDADAFLTTLRRRGRSPHMQRLARVVLSMAFKLAVRRRRAAFNPVDAVAPISVPRMRMATWDEAEVAQFLAAARGDRYYNLFVLALSTGMREGELLALRTRDVDVRNGALHVQETAREGGRGPVTTGSAKTQSSRRRIDLPARALAALREEIAKHPNATYVFPDVNGGAFAARNLRQRHFRPIADRCACGHAPHPVRKALKQRKATTGKCASCSCEEWMPVLRRIRFHDLRHTFATIALSNDVPVKVVSEILGHSSIKITLDTYGHVVPSMQREAAVTMDGFLGRVLEGRNATHDATSALPVEPSGKKKSLPA